MNRTDWTTIERTANGETYRFDCYSYDTRHGFAHYAELRDGGGRVLGEHRAYYLNRTWERWRYQSACVQIVRDLIDEERRAARLEWMDARGYKRMNDKRRAEYEAARVETARGRGMRALLFALEDRPTAYEDACGARERAVLLDGPVSVETVETAPGHEVYRIVGASGASCLWDQADKRFVG